MAGPGWMWDGFLALGLTAAFIGLLKFLDILYKNALGEGDSVFALSRRVNEEEGD